MTQLPSCRERPQLTPTETIVLMPIMLLAALALAFFILAEVTR